ncbi:MAG: hypothetical protein WDW36_002501 [Sanguina aurantia]
MPGPNEPVATLSTFGAQILSTKPSQPRARFGTSGRVANLAEEPFQSRLLGATSLGITTRVASGFGVQTSSGKFNAPSHRFAGRYSTDHEMEKEARPGPGYYSCSATVGRQILSCCPTSPAARIGSAGRFGQTKALFSAASSGPGSVACRPARGWLGDSPTYSFHGSAKRSDISMGMPAQRPTAADAPAPGHYETAASAFGPQVTSVKASAARTRVGTADRSRSASVQYLSEEHATEKLCRGSPPPGTYSPRCDAELDLQGGAVVAMCTRARLGWHEADHLLQAAHPMVGDLQQATVLGGTSSRVRSASSCKFGSGDRFSELKPLTNKSHLSVSMTFSIPGPGTYVV